MKFTFFLFILISIHLGVLGQEAPIRKKEFLLEKGVALSGFDPTSYFTKKPQKGIKNFSYVHDGVKYLVANAENQAAFIKNPAKYEPQYGGWCAYAMGSKGEKVEIDPETYKITDGKLYLFFHTFYKNTINDWNKDEKFFKQKADYNWSKIIKSKP
jgi:hypothetical protein